jgi:hypothetical protein
MLQKARSSTGIGGSLEKLLPEGRIESIVLRIMLRRVSLPFVKS